jgi:hypothetical protein
MHDPGLTRVAPRVEERIMERLIPLAVVFVQFFDFLWWLR